MDAIPIRAFLALLTAGVLSPRPVARRIIDARPDGRERLLLVGLGAVIQAFFFTLLGVVAPSGPTAGFGVGGLFLLLLISFANYAITATLGFHLGRRFGGRGSAEEVATAVAWHAVLVSALSPLQVAALGGGAGSPEMGAAGFLMLSLYAGLNVWLLASCVAEAHGFASTARVAAATVGLFVTLALLLGLLVGGLGGA